MTPKKAVIPWFLYLIKTANGSFYTGISTDLNRRFAEHQAQSSKTAKALRGKGPLKLMFAVKLHSHSEALKAELWVKKQTKACKAALIQGTRQLPFEHSIVNTAQYAQQC